MASEGKHTPGPWTVRKAKWSEALRIAVGKLRVCSHVAGNDDWVVDEMLKPFLALLSRYEASKQKNEPAPITSKPGWDGRQYAEARGDYPLEVEDADT